MARKLDKDGIFSEMSEHFDISEFQISNSEILEILKKAKEYYTFKNISNVLGMCFRIHRVLLVEYHVDVSYGEIEYIIPEFNPDFLGGKINSQNYWWNTFDGESRIAAFDTLINTYDKKQWISYRY